MPLLPRWRCRGGRREGGSSGARPHGGCSPRAGEAAAGRRAAPAALEQAAFKNSIMEGCSTYEDQCWQRGSAHVKSSLCPSRMQHHPCAGLVASKATLRARPSTCRRPSRVSKHTSTARVQTTSRKWPASCAGRVGAQRREGRLGRREKYLTRKRHRHDREVEASEAWSRCVYESVMPNHPTKCVLSSPAQTAPSQRREQTAAAPRWPAPRLRRPRRCAAAAARTRRPGQRKLPPLPPAAEGSSGWGRPRRRRPSGRLHAPSEAGAGCTKVSNACLRRCFHPACPAARHCHLCRCLCPPRAPALQPLITHSLQPVTLSFPGPHVQSC